MKKTFLISLLIMAHLLLSAQEYKVMSYNIRYDNPGDGQDQWPHRREQLCLQIRYYQPDILGIQEGLHHQVQYIDSVLTGYHFAGVGRDDGKTKGEYSAVFYRKDRFRKVEGTTFWLSETPGEISVGWDASMERICTAVLLEDLQTGERIQVYNTHFDHRGEQARLKSARLILGKIQDVDPALPVVLTGDMNALPESAPIETLVAGLTDSYTGSRLEPYGSKGTYGGFDACKKAVRRIDYVFLNDHWKIMKYLCPDDDLNNRRRSDHLPVLVTIRLSTDR